MSELELGPVMIQLDARTRDVDVPDAHAEDPRLVLLLGYGLKPEIPCIAVSDHGWAATLTFSGVPHSVFVPWDAIAAIQGESGQEIYPPDTLPIETVVVPPKRPSHLRSV